MWNLPITHNKSSNRWKNVRHPLHACTQQQHQLWAACCTSCHKCCHTFHLAFLGAQHHVRLLCIYMCKLKHAATA